MGEEEEEEEEVERVVELKDNGTVDSQRDSAHGISL